MQVRVLDGALAQLLDVVVVVHRHPPRLPRALLRYPVEGTLDVSGGEVQHRPGLDTVVADLGARDVVAPRVHVAQQAAEVLAQQADLQRP